MVWLSTPATIYEQKVSVLALVEATLALALGLIILSVSRSSLHIVLAAAAAPFLLLQTERSNQRALSLAAASSHWLMRVLEHAFPNSSRLEAITHLHERGTGPFTSTLFFFLTLICVILLETYIAALYFSLLTLLLVILLFGKSAAVIIETIARPLDSLAAIPDNWRKTVLCTDSATLPEIIPGLESYPGFEDTFLLRFVKVVPHLRSLPSIAARVAGILYIAIFLYVPAAFYRWSIKSTALIWSPLLWIFRPLQAKEAAGHFAEGIVTLTKYKLSRAYSTIVLVILGFKICILLTWTSFKSFLEALYGWSLISHYLVPEAIPGWHVAAAANAVISWVILFRAEKYLLDVRIGAPSSPERIRRFFVISFIFRNLLSAYTVACTLYLTFELAGRTDLSKIRIIGFPW
ncbi:hypothetical protein [Bradyrhizobium sp. AZCC 2230]|uniref:hypothetical protein n=1 Tax=Bradyrhizobium sp. AZCC 2230 TaxID=3117021 RepID=UPI002FF0790D